MAGPPASMAREVIRFVCPLGPRPSTRADSTPTFPMKLIDLSPRPSEQNGIPQGPMHDHRAAEGIYDRPTWWRSWHAVRYGEKQR